MLPKHIRSSGFFSLSLFGTLHLNAFLRIFHHINLNEWIQLYKTVSRDSKGTTDCGQVTTPKGRGSNMPRLTWSSSEERSRRGMGVIDCFLRSNSFSFFENFHIWRLVPTNWNTQRKSRNPTHILTLLIYKFKIMPFKMLNIKLEVQHEWISKPFWLSLKRSSCNLCVIKIKINRFLY